jgi:hypothetical protein
MPVTLPNPPDDAVRAARESLAQIRSEHPAQPSLVYPHRVYLMDVFDVAEGRTLDAARAGPWRHLIARKSRVEESLDVVDTNRGNHRMTTRSRGPRNRAMARQIERAMKTPEFRDEPFEARLLSVPALSLTALWLVGENRSVVIPIGPARLAVKTGARYSSEEFLAALQPIAQARLQFDNSPRFSES